MRRVSFRPSLTRPGITDRNIPAATAVSRADSAQTGCRWTRSSSGSGSVPAISGTAGLDDQRTIVRGHLVGLLARPLLWRYCAGVARARCQVLPAAGLLLPPVSGPNPCGAYSGHSP